MLPNLYSTTLKRNYCHNFLSVTYSPFWYSSIDLDGLLRNFFLTFIRFNIIKILLFMNKIWIQISKNDESKTDPVLLKRFAYNNLLQPLGLLSITAASLHLTSRFLNILNIFQQFHY